MLCKYLWEDFFLIGDILCAKSSVQIFLKPLLLYLWTLCRSESGSQVWMWELDHGESWVPRNWCFWTVCWRRLFESLLDSKNNQSILKEICPPDSLEGLMAEAEAPVLWPPDGRNWLIWKDPDAGKDWRQEEKGTTEDEMLEWHHRLDNTWVWASSGSWWTGKPDVLQSMRSQRVGHHWVTKLHCADHYEGI